MNAAQLYLTGCIVPCHAENVCMVVAEGGEARHCVMLGGGRRKASNVVPMAGRRALKKFTRLMTQRIDWNKKAPGEESDSEEEEEKQEKFGGIEKRCDLVWQGTVPRRNFPAFRVENECRSIETARRLMAQMNLAHYWDMVRSSCSYTAQDLICNFHCQWSFGSGRKIQSPRPAERMAARDEQWRRKQR